MGGPEPHAGLVTALRLQGQGCRHAGSDLYARILEVVADDAERGGICLRLLATDDEEPLASALPLRFLGAIHRIVLAGQEPELARHYPSAGGDAARDGLGPAFLAAVERHAAEIERRLGDGVQTNEVGRSAVLVGGYAEITRRSGLPLRVLEIGASGGLNLRWDRYWYATGSSTFGDPESPVRFTDVWEGSGPDLAVAMEVGERRGCDRSPIDATSEDGRLTLLSYLWPDQPERIERLDAALRIARRCPVEIDQADAPTWVEAQLASPRPGLATVLVHSIVLQYLPPEGRARLREVVESAGARATSDAPLHWLRMEPGGQWAELRLTSWPDGGEDILAHAGYHGRPVRWGR